ncbi:FMN-dependent NADH-azoreductase [Aurantiacibacter sp. D1-12]|uniref:FMN-dependent NADH-azoreductase n=1 Tax=Aurantiacibacter sp. D1-12 TaxID=2993658 RepID=UPI00237CA704|nr:NAD(P)H-dependent oxidoreductase [Aurantiacibacter sp. D1-12]MDE1467476.1 NAD(P)H-dependent oxidoreductase [Aurantiacibacter sp. D1-12]
MPTILHITASIRGDESVSRDLSNRVVASLTEGSDARVITRDLSKNDLPFIDAVRFAANLAPHAERTSEQQDLAAIADTLIDELQQADTIVLGVPIYNFSVPATVKAWADLVARAGTTFQYTSEGPKGMLEGKKAYIAVASGGTLVGSDYDHMTPWLKFFLGFIGIHDVEMVAADGIMGRDGEEKIAAAKQAAERIAA